MPLSGQEMVLQGISIMGSVLYLLVAFVLSRRAISGPGKGAHQGFIVWWGGLAALGVITSYFAFVRPYASFGLIGGRVALYGLVVLVLVMLAGLAYYLLYLYTGRQDMLVASVVFYSVLFVYFVVITEIQRPFIDMSSGTAVWAYQNPLGASSPWSLLLSLGLIGPPLAAAIAYVALYRRADDLTVKYRIAMVSGAFILWFGFSAISSVMRAVLSLAETPFGAQLVSQLMGVLAAALVLLAYIPPGFIRAKGVHGVFDHTAADALAVISEPVRRAAPTRS